MVFDTNVLLAAFLTEGLCGKILRRARRGEFDLFLSPWILEEFQRILTRKFRASSEERDSASALVRESAMKILQRIEAVEGACRDPDDDHILACAVSAGADFLVTGDQDLLMLKVFRGTRILTPRDFEAMMEG